MLVHFYRETVRRLTTGSGQDQSVGGEIGQVGAMAEVAAVVAVAVAAVAQVQQRRIEKGVQ
jgi:hypothetical protein